MLLLVIAALASLPGCEATIVEPTLPPAWTESEASRPLTRADCVALAAGSAPTAAAWEARRLGARARLHQASLLPNPVLSLGWEDFGLNHAASGSDVQTTLSLALALADVAARGRREHAARFELEAEEADLHAERQRLAASVFLAYDELLAARERVALQSELADVAERQRHDVGLFVESGVSPRVELERAEAEAGQAAADLVVARADERGRELEFAFALGFERPTPLALAGTLDEAAADDGREASGGGRELQTMAALDDLLAAAAAARPELAAARARYDAERERLSLQAERVRFLPTVFAGPRTQGDELRGVAGLDVELPLFDSGAAAEDESQAALLAAAAALRATAHDVARQVSAARERVEAAEAFLNDHARDLASRRRALRERTERLFREGQIEYAELALVRRDEVQARVALLEAQGAAAAARVELRAALGDFAEDG